MICHVFTAGEEYPRHEEGAEQSESELRTPVIDKLKAVRRYLVDADGRSLDVLPLLVSEIGSKSTAEGKQGVNWSIGLAFRRNDSISSGTPDRERPEKEWYHSFQSSFMDSWKSLVSSEAGPLVVEKVLRAGPACSLDIQEGDVIQHIDGHPVDEGCSDVGHGVGKTSVLNLRRGSLTLQAKVAHTAPAFVRAAEDALSLLDQINSIVESASDAWEEEKEGKRERGPDTLVPGEGKAVPQSAKTMQPLKGALPLLEQVRSMIIGTERERQRQEYHHAQVTRIWHVVCLQELRDSVAWFASADVY